MQPPPLLNTDVPNLDVILGGGLPRGAVTLIMGVPGSGKTTLAAQIAFAAAARGQPVLFLTILSESSNKLIEHLKSYAFYQESFLSTLVQVFSLQDALKDGLEIAADVVIKEARRFKSQMVVLDGFGGLRGMVEHPHQARAFLYALGTRLSTLGITLVITSESDPHDPTLYPETTTADVIVGLQFDLNGVRQRRGIEVIKSRGIASLPGLHALTISQAGVHVYPQLEERVVASLLGSDALSQGAAPLEDTPLPPLESLVLARAPIGLPELDTLLHGGLPRATCTVVAGSIGVGKTFLSLHFALAGVRAGESVVLLTFRETRDQLLQAAHPFTLGPELHAALASGRLTLIAIPAIKVHPDVIADRLLATIDRTRASRLVVDSIAELEQAVGTAAAPERLRDYLVAFMTALRVRNVTTVFIKETQKAIAPTLDFTAGPLEVLAESVMLLQQVTHQARLVRVMSVLKMRFSGHDTALREFIIAPPEGIRVLAPIESEAGMIQEVTEQQDMARQAHGTS